MKKIKPPLPIDGTHVRTIAELQDHFSTEILDLYKNGMLLRWLQMKGYTSHAEAVQRLLLSEPDGELLKLLCGIFEIEVEAEIIQQLADYHGSGIKIDPEQLKMQLAPQRPQGRGRIMGFDNEWVGSSVTLEMLTKMHKWHTGEDILLVPINFQVDMMKYSDDSSAKGFVLEEIKYITELNHKLDYGDSICELRLCEYSSFTGGFGDIFNLNIVTPCSGLLYKKVCLGNRINDEQQHSCFSDGPLYTTKT